MFSKLNPAENTKKATGNCRKSGIFFCSLFYLSYSHISRRCKANAIIFILASFLAPCFLPRQCSILRSRHWETAKFQGVLEKTQDKSLTSFLRFLFWADRIFLRNTHWCLGRAFPWAQAGPAWSCVVSLFLSCVLSHSPTLVRITLLRQQVEGSKSPC